VRELLQGKLAEQKSASRSPRPTWFLLTGCSDLAPPAR